MLLDLNAPPDDGDGAEPEEMDVSWTVGLSPPVQDLQASDRHGSFIDLNQDATQG